MCALAFAALIFNPGPGLGSAEQIQLRPAEPGGSPDQVELTVEAEGKILVRRGNKVESAPTQAEGRFKFWERPVIGYLSENATEIVRGGIRWFELAETTGRVGSQQVTVTLRPDRRLILARTGGTDTLLWSLSGPLTRGELDLLQPTLATLGLAGLLPPQPVGEGSKWTIPADVAGVLVGLEGVTLGGVEATMLEVVGDIVRVEFSGRLEGAAEAVHSEITLKGRYQFSISKGRVIWLGLAYHEKRESGPIAPGVDLVTKVAISVKPDQQCPQVEDPQLVSGIFEPAPELLLLEQQAPDGLWRLHYGRRWHFTAITDDWAVLRLVDRGTFLAQCKIARGQPPKGEMSLARFQADIRDSFGAQFHRFIQASELRSLAGTPIYRVEAQGMVNGVPVIWIFYWVRGPQAEPLVISFTLEQSLYERFGQADREILDGLRFRVDEVALRPK